MQQTEERVSRLIQNFSRFHHFIKRWENVGELRAGELSILRCIQHHADPETGEMRPSQISARLGLQQPTITPSLRALEEKGYLRRRNSDRDRREVYYSLTDQTRELAREESRRTAEMFSGLAGYLGEEDTARLMDIMDRVSGYLDQLREEQGGCGRCGHRRRPEETE